jgi:hypothetical protein
MGERPWGDATGRDMERRVAAWAHAGVDIVYLEPDPGALAWPQVPLDASNPSDAHMAIWRTFILSWAEQAMRSDGPVWVLPWARRLITPDGREWPDGAALAEGLAELCRERPVVVAPRAGRWTGRSPAIGAVHQPECLGSPPASAAERIRHRVQHWPNPGATVALIGHPSEARSWGQPLMEAMVGAHMVGGAVAVEIYGMPDDGGWPTGTTAASFALCEPPDEDRAANWDVAALSPLVLAQRPGLATRLLAACPDLALVGPDIAAGDGRAAGYAAVTLPQYRRALGSALLLRSVRARSDLPWDERFRALARAACPRCLG